MPIFPVAIAVALGIVIMLRKARFNYERLPKIPYVSGASLPEIDIVVPARNEERSIAELVRCFPEGMTTVVDDHSEDRTAASAEQAGARVIPAPPLADGWLGKPNACMAGARAGNAEWLLFADADTLYARVFLPSLLQYAETESLDMLSVFLRRQTVSLSERVVLPYAFALYFTGVSAGGVNGRPPSQWLANGQCLLFKRSAYESLGGHSAVRDSVIEDVALARLAAGKGLRTRVARAEHLGSVRMYDGWAAILRGFEKNAFRFLRQNPFTGSQVIFSSILLTSWLPVLLLLLADGLPRQALLFGLLPSVILMPGIEARRRCWRPSLSTCFSTSPYGRCGRRSPEARPNGRAARFEALPDSVARSPRAHAAYRPPNALLSHPVHRKCYRPNRAPPKVTGLEHLPVLPRFVLAANHYQRKGLWILLPCSAITAALRAHYGLDDPPIRWIVTANWPPWRLGRLAIPSPGDWLLPRVAHALHGYPVSFAGSHPALTARSYRSLLKAAASVDARSACSRKACKARRFAGQNRCRA